MSKAWHHLSGRLWERTLCLIAAFARLQPSCWGDVKTGQRALEVECSTVQPMSSHWQAPPRVSTDAQLKRSCVFWDPAAVKSTKGVMQCSQYSSGWFQTLTARLNRKEMSPALAASVLQAKWRFYVFLIFASIIYLYASVCYIKFGPEPAACPMVFLQLGVANHTKL